jgi:hypothetical protein
MANHVFLELCKLVSAIDYRVEASYIAEETLLDECHSIERDLHNANVRLYQTMLGRENCAKYKLRKHLGER